MKVAICYSGLKNEEIYKISRESLLSKLCVDGEPIKDYDIIEYCETLNFDKNKYIKYDGGPTMVSTNTIEPMFHKIYMCNEKKKQSKNNYDVCIRVRFDFVLLDRIDLDKLELNKFTIPNYGITSFDGEIVSVCDFFCISNSKNMDKYCDVYNVLPILFDKSILSNPESLIREHLGINNIDLRNINHYVRRSNGQRLKFWQGAKELSEEQKKQLRKK